MDHDCGSRTNFVEDFLTNKKSTFEFSTKISTVKFKLFCTVIEVLFLNRPTEARGDAAVPLLRRRGGLQGVEGDGQHLRGEGSGGKVERSALLEVRNIILHILHILSENHSSLLTGTASTGRRCIE